MASSVCRVCLIGNTRMLNIDDIHLLEMYEKLTDTKLQSERENVLPSTVCYVCHQQLQKCYRFSHVAHKSNKILQDLLQNGTEITPNMVTMLHQGMHNLSVTETKNISINIDSDTGSSAESMSMNIESGTGCSAKTIKEEHVVDKEEETNGTDEIDIEEIKLEMPDHVEYDDISINTKLSLNNDKYKHNNMLPLCYGNECNIKKTSKYQLSRQLTSHTKTKLHFCSTCDKSFTKECNVATHMLVHTEKKPFSCKKCDKAFRNKYDLTTHKLVHIGVKPHSCKRCDKAFTCKSSLKNHMLVHTGVKPHSCNICGKAFTQKCNLTTHMLIHTGEKPYSCSICDMAFTQRITLTNHMLTHTGEKPYSCKICDKGFFSKSNLVSHMPIHSEVKPYTCNICDKAFTKKYDLKRHIIRLHNHNGKKP